MNVYFINNDVHTHYEESDKWIEIDILEDYEEAKRKFNH